MAQHDYNIADQNGADFLADLNNALGAIATQNSGATAPSNPYPNQVWIDTSTNPPTRRRRNNANTAWDVELGTIATQNANNVAITGGSINNTPIGQTTPAAGSFTTLSASGALTVLHGTSRRTDDVGQFAYYQFADAAAPSAGHLTWGIGKPGSSNNMAVWTWDGSVISQKAEFTPTGLSVTGGLSSTAGITDVNGSGVGSLILGNTQGYGTVASGGGGTVIYLNGATRGGASFAASGVTVFASDAPYYWTNSAVNTTKMALDTSGNLTPGADNTQNFGSGALRWATIYAGTGTINTSDAREKTAVSQLSDAELNAAKQLSKEIGVYQFLASIESKGDAARKHIGLTVQRAIEIMEANGLNPFSYGFICYDEWDTQTVEHPAIESVEAQDAVLDEDGNVVKQAIEAVEAKDAWTEVVVEAGNRYGFRYDQLNMFIARGIEARLSALEAA